MTDSSPPSSPDPRFCGECGSALLPDATFCGECGAAALADADEQATGDAPEDDAAPDAEAAEGAEPPAGASDWSGVQTVVDRGEPPSASSLPPPTAPPVTVPVPNVPPPPGPSTQAVPAAPAAPAEPAAPGGPAGPSAPAPDAAGGGTGKGNGPKVLVGILVLVALVAGAFFVLGGDDDDGDTSDTTFQRDRGDDPDDDDPDDDETTTTGDDGDGETTTTAGDDDPVEGFTTLVDDTGTLTVDVPADWTDVVLGVDDDPPRLLAAPDVDAFQTGFTVPGVDFRLLSQSVPPEQFDTSLDTVANTITLPNSCTSEGKQDYSDGVFTGRAEVWSQCAGIDTEMLILFARQDDGQTVFLALQLTAEDDPAIAQRVLDTFLIVG